MRLDPSFYIGERREGTGGGNRKRRERRKSRKVRERRKRIKRRKEIMWATVVKASSGQLIPMPHVSLKILKSLNYPRRTQFCRYIT